MRAYSWRYPERRKIFFIGQYPFVFSTSAYETCTFTTNIILEGIHVSDMKQKCFSGEILSFEHLRNWYREDMIQVQDTGDSQIYTCKLNDTQNGRSVKLRDGKEVVFIPTYRNTYTQWYNEVHLYQSAQIALTTPELYSVWNFLEKATIEKPPNLFGGRFPFLKCHMQR